MSTATLALQLTGSPPFGGGQAPVTPADGQGRVLLRRVSWQTYQALLSEVGDDSVHLTYDDGLLEIEVPSERHEQLKSAVRTMLEDTLKAGRTPFEPLGSTTWNTRARTKGIEADECYYVQHVADVKGKRPIDLNVSPPPDLAVEVEVTAGAVDKLGIYAALGVPEVWRVSADGTVSVLLRDTDGRYVPAAASAAVPVLPPGVLTDFLRRLEPYGSLGYSDMVIEFDRWLDAVRVNRG